MISNICKLSSEIFDAVPDTEEAVLARSLNKSPLFHLESQIIYMSSESLSYLAMS